MLFDTKARPPFTPRPHTPTRIASKADPDMTSFGDRHSLLDHHYPAKGLGLPHGRLTGAAAPDLDGGYRVSHV
jgi:hypothetical protein